VGAGGTQGGGTGRERRVMRPWGADGIIEMECGHDFTMIVCFYLRKIATEGVGIGGCFDT